MTDDTGHVRESQEGVRITQTKAMLRCVIVCVNSA